MNRKRSILILAAIFSLSLLKTTWQCKVYNLTYVINKINFSASRRVPFKRSETLTKIANEISVFQQIIQGNSELEIESEENEIIKRQQKIITKLIKDKKVLCNKETTNFGLTILPADIQLDIKGTNLPPPIFPLSVTSKGKQTFFQLIVSSYEDINKLELEFTSNNKQSIECYLGDYVYCNPSPYYNKGKWYQDPLFPFEKIKNKFKLNRKKNPLKKGDSFPIWIKLKQSSKGLILNCKVTMTGKTKSSITTTIKINKTLNKRKNLNLSILNSYYPGWTNYYYQDSSLLSNNTKKNELFIKNSLLDPTLLYCSARTGLYPEIKKNIDNKGPIVIYFFQNFKEIFTDSLKQKEILLTIQKREKYLNTINQLDNSYIYLYDELPKNQNYKLIWTSKWLKKNGIKSKLLTASSYLSGEEEIDIWCVPLQNYEESKSKYKGEMWVYICNTTLPPYPNFLIESDKKDFDKLYLFFEERPRIKGFLYYATNNWRGNMINHGAAFHPISQHDKEVLLKRKDNIRWPDIPWISYSYKDFNGDGYLFYPNKNGLFIPSTRLLLYQNLLLDIKKNL